MIPESSGKIESAKNEADELSRLLELELQEKRAAWQRASGRYHAIKMFSFLFLFLVVVGAIAASFMLFTRLNERRGAPSNAEPVTETR